ncbi:YfdX protein [Thiogranum longum]|uniref:YfdX protein n=1 Tax=Thiogranum longum TaxID=1537524 RepID=A0A4R1H6M5_9GAMM|nr:YfdX family protein [Thiogranum longum]TCK17394.1 YfdX protein [Thiogranum longum]
MDISNGKTRGILPGWVLAGVLSVPLVVMNNMSVAAVQPDVVKQGAVTQAEKAAEKKQEKFSAEAMAALKSVDEAISLLKDGKKDVAVKKLEIASGKLEVAMAANPSLKLIPIATEVRTYELITTPKQVKADLDAVDDLLESGDVQGARALLSGMRSEVVTETIYIPMETYPDAIKRAVREITANQSRKARATLIEAMGTLVKDTLVMPLPVVLAQGAIEDAMAVQASDKDEALRDLEYASVQLEIARQLGYFYDTKDDYKTLKKNIEDIEQALKGKSKTGQLFDDVKNGFGKLVDKFTSGKEKK